MYSNSNGTVAFTANWTEGGGETTSPTGGDISINGGRLQFNQNVDGGETIQRSINLAGATAATVSFAYEDDNLGAGQSVLVQAWNISTSTWDLLPGGTLGSTTANGTGTFTATLTANQIGAASAIRFLTVGDGNNWDNGDNFYVDNFTVNVTAPGLNAGADTVNGGAGDDTIIWNANAAAPTDGRDIVNGGTEGAVGDTFVITGNASQRDLQHLYAGRLGCRRRQRSQPALADVRRRSSSPAAARRFANVIAELTRDRRNPHQRRRSFRNDWRRRSRRHLQRHRRFLGRPACASIPSPSMATPATTRSTYLVARSPPTASSSSRTAATTPSSERCDHRT